MTVVKLWLLGSVVLSTEWYFRDELISLWLLLEYCIFTQQCLLTTALRKLELNLFFFSFFSLNLYYLIH